jgi:cytochrome c-type biogenesis protein CcmE
MAMTGRDKSGQIRDPKTAKALGAKGGKASGVTRKRKANVRKAVSDILANTMTKVEVDGVLQDMTVEEGMVTVMAKMALDGDVQAFRALMTALGNYGRSELDEREQKARMQKIEMEVKMMKQTVDAVSGDPDSMPDDGFLKALEGAGKNDWAED